MLNRRILRVKAMQGLYAYYNSMDANYNLSIDQIKDNFNTLLLNDHSIDKKENEKNKRLTIKLFEDAVAKKEYKSLKNDNVEAEILAKEIFKQYKDASKKDFNYYRKNIVSGAEKIFEHYLLLLQLPFEFAEFEMKESQLKENGKSNRTLKTKTTQLTSNKIIVKLKKDKGLKDLALKYKVSWVKYQDIVEELYNTLVKKNKEYIKYSEIPLHSMEDDRKFCLFLYKDLLFKKDPFNDFMESIDISWFDDSEVLKSMVTKTIKNLDDENSGIEFSTLSKNWPEDKQFFCDIFDLTIKHDREYDEMIALKSKNWDITRIAFTDRIILKMAIGEMINFPGIPVKVTINEYIELSKNFSTPKSKKFVNGILDVISAELVEKGVIKKSGRGLLDNH